MCGIVGGNGFGSKEDIQISLDKIKHRGRDYQEIYEYKNIFMGHNRLSIVDLSDYSNQPFHSKDDNYVIVFNGELFNRTIDNFSYLRKKYNINNYKSDVELLLLIYIEYSDDLIKFMSSLDGMFCFCILDKIKNKLVLGRDYIGRLPFHYKYDSKLIFASEKKCFDTNDNICDVQPGTVLEYFLDTNELKMSKYFTFDNINYDKIDKGENYYTTNIRRLLNAAIDNELVSDVPICTILSGGIDSTLITYLLSKRIQNITSFVINISGTTNSKKILKDDLYFAKKFSEENNIKLVIIDIPFDVMKEKLQETIYAIESENYIQLSFAIAQILLAKEISNRGFKVVFGGDVSDEIFGSYDDVKRWCWNDETKYHNRRISLVKNVNHKNLSTLNKSMMYGGTIEARTPFADYNFVNFCLRIPPKYRDENNGKGKHLKYILRKSFENIISDEFLWRKKVPFQNGCHSDKFDIRSAIKTNKLIKLDTIEKSE